ncbi:hypothetical protein ACC702_38870, partial [Rhizobium ruizarguesonis]
MASASRTFCSSQEFIDQQPQMAFGVQSIDRQVLKNNVETTITTVETDSFSGNTFPELLAVVP